MTLLSSCTHISRACQLEAPSSIVGSANPTARLLLACAQDAGESLARRAEWAALIREHTFNSANGTTDYALPSDFQRFIDGTAWNRATYYSLRGPMSAQQWQAFKSSAFGQSVSIGKRWRLKWDTADAAVRFFLDPTPTATEALVFEYISNAWCQSSGAVAQSAWVADADTFRLDEWLLKLHLKWRVLERLGMSYLEARTEADRETDKAVARDGGMPRLSMVPPNSGPHFLSTWDVVDTGYGESA